ncbi:hypothetical protein ACIQXD_32845 [Streptomyces uncialis]|uniref:hypothetical protein n=1 Tax=Streptomyces uncialis TaxID=1048205 RepID=UPI003817839D
MTPVNEEGEPRFLVLDYVTITRDPRSRLVVAIGGDERAAGILQATGYFVSAAGPRGPYHRQPHALPVEEQCQGATAAAHALLLAGFSVHLDPALNILGAPDGDRQAAHRYLQRLTERARAAADNRAVSGLLTEIGTPLGLLPRIDEALRSTWFVWLQRLKDSGQDTTPAEQLMDTTAGLARHTRQIEQIRNTAATRPATTPPRAVATAAPTAPPARLR